MVKDVWKARWVKISPLSKGGQAFTYRVRPPDQSADDPCSVLKELKHQRDPKRRARMFQEVENLRRLDHPNIAKCIESNAAEWKTDVELYVIMEHIPGPTLAEAISAAVMSVTDSQQLLIRLLDVIEYCHAQGVVHRDIKPDNIILRNGHADDPVLIDFGLSFNEDTQPTEFETEANDHVGSRFISLPEQMSLSEDKRAPVSDVTQLVGILFFVLTGANPGPLLDSGSQPPHQRRHARGRIDGIDQAVLQQLDRIFDVGFAIELARRWQSASLLAVEIAKLTPHPTSRMSFEERLAVAAKLVVETPEFVIAQRLQDLESTVPKEFQSLIKQTKKQMGGKLKCDPAPRPAVDVSPAKAALTYSLYTIYEPDRKVAISVFAHTENREFIVRGSVGNDVCIISKFGIFDPEAQIMIRQGIENLIVDVLMTRVAKRES